MSWRLVAAAVVLGACGNQSGGGNGGPAAAPQALVGRVALTGAEPRVDVTLQLPGRAVILIGEYRDELARLAGAEVAVEGTPEAGRDVLRVTSYELRRVEGRVPRVGEIVVAGGELWLEADRRYRLVQPPERLREAAGAKVWVLGRPAEGGLVVQSFGIIRPPARD